MAAPLRRLDHLHARMDQVRQALAELELYWLATAPDKTPAAGRYGRLTTADVAEARAVHAFRTLLVAEANRLFCQDAVARRCGVSKRALEEACSGRTHGPG